MRGHLAIDAPVAVASVARSDGFKVLGDPTIAKSIARGTAIARNRLGQTRSAGLKPPLEAVAGSASDIDHTGVGSMSDAPSSTPS
jgi:hypothetical protein